MPAAERGEALVVLAGEDEDRHPERAAARPTAAPGCRCRPGGGCWPGRRRCSAVDRRGRRRPPAGRRTAVGPASARGTGRARRAPARSPSTSSERRRAARSWLVLDPGGRAEEHQGVDLVGPVQGEVQRQPAAHRVADVGRPATGVTEQRRARRQVGSHRRRAAVARCVDQHDLVVAAEVGGDRAPRAPGLGEAVDEHDPRAGPPALDVEGGHAGSDAAASSSATRSSTRRNVSGSCAPGTDHRPSKT